MKQLDWCIFSSFFRTLLWINLYFLPYLVCLFQRAEFLLFRKMAPSFWPSYIFIVIKVVSFYRYLLFFHVVGSTAGLVFVQYRLFPEKRILSSLYSHFWPLCQILTWSWGTSYRPPACHVTSHTRNHADGCALYLVHGGEGSLARPSSSAFLHRVSSLPYLTVSHPSKVVVFEQFRDFVSVTSIYFLLALCTSVITFPSLLHLKGILISDLLQSALCYSHSHFSSGTVSCQTARGWGGGGQLIAAQKYFLPWNQRASHSFPLFVL